MSHFALSACEWIVPALLLLVVAWVRFNTPPTNRSGTTFALFYFGVIFYYGLILALWLLVTVSGIGFGSLAAAKGQVAQHAPIFGALIIVVASQFPQVLRIDIAARKFCFSLAAIPREADRLSVELAQSADFQPPSDQLRDRVTKIISDNIDFKTVNFDMDATISARFTRAVALYWLFIGPNKNSTHLEFRANAHGRSAYAAIMQLNEATASRASARYEEIMHAGRAYFTSTRPTEEVTEALNRTTRELSNLVCSLIARYVLYCDRTRRGRQQRLSTLGFDASHLPPHFGMDQWAATIFIVIALSILMMRFMPGTRPPAATQLLIIAITYGVSIGFAVMGGVVVAQRFIERHEGEKPAFPPFAELVLAALIVVGLSMAMRIGIPLVPALFGGGSFALQSVVTHFWERLPGIITPFVCTISLGLLCSYVDLLNRTSFRVAAVGALGNALALSAAGFLVGNLLDDSVLSQFFSIQPDQARLIVIANTGLTGAVVGAIVLTALKQSEHARKVVAELAKHLPVADDCSVLPAESFGVPSASVGVAPEFLGGYSRSNAEELEGCYICFRPGFSAPNLITAYVVVIRWDEAESCLIFEEQGRADAAHTQKGRVYIPDGRPFLSLVRVERGALRLIMVSRPDKKEPGRGLIMTLSNPGGLHFTPSSAPIILRRIVGQVPRIGYIGADLPEYQVYRGELETVIPAFGLLGAPPQSSIPLATALTKSSEGVRLSVVS
jgi:hypothetical protein